MKTFTIVVLTLLTLSCAGQKTNDKVIICLTYDDGLDSHVRTVIPQLDSLGMKATFFLTSVRGSSEIISQSNPSVVAWRKAALNGHELANHTLFHPCSQQIGWQKDASIEIYTLDALLNEIRAANLFLNALDKTRTTRAYAFPCNNTIVDGVDYAKHLKAQKLVTYARGGDFKPTFVSDGATLDIMNVPSWLVPEGVSLEELIRFANDVKKNGKMGVYQFHAIGGELFNVSPAVHKKFLEFLKENEADFLVTTFSDAMGRLTAK